MVKDKSPMQIMPDGTIQPVITLRDQFAMHLASGMLASGNWHHITWHNIMKQAYEGADEMMKARELLND